VKEALREDRRLVFQGEGNSGYLFGSLMKFLCLEDAELAFWEFSFWPKNVKNRMAYGGGG